MKRLPVILCVTLVVCAAIDVGQVRAQSFTPRRPPVPGSSQAAVHNPYSPRYVPLLPNQPIRQGPRLQWRVPQTIFFGTYFDPWNSPFYVGPPPPVYINSEVLYGPRAGARWSADPPPIPDPPAAEVDRKPRQTNMQTKAQAGKFMKFGDTHFGNQKYSQALTRYRTAASLAPDVSEIYLRQGFALIALGKYDAAPGMLRRALRLRGNWSGDDFRLDDVYDSNLVAKTVHRELLAKAVEDSPLDGDLLFLLGMHMYFDGQQQRARTFFQRSVQLGADDEKLLDELVGKRAAGDGERVLGRIEF